MSAATMKMEKPGSNAGAQARKRIDVVIGTRPEAIKMAPVVLELRRREKFSVRVVATGQHTEMLTQALGYFSLSADVNLAIMKERQSLDYVTASVLLGVGEVFDAAPPDAVLVHGDTTTTFAASLAAFYRKIPVGHVEAGLRSFDMRQPFPEEMNRVMTDRVAAWWFAPTEGSKKNLLAEGASEERIFVTGNTVVDALRVTLAEKREPSLPSMSPLKDGNGNDSENDKTPFLLLTAHRRESWGKPMERICAAALELLKRHPQYRLLAPMHKNPAVREVMREYFGNVPGIILCDPLEYPDFVWAMDRCELILSDSGGVQEEASSMGKPVLILRDITERPEAVEQGSCVLVGTDPERILLEAGRFLSNAEAREALKKRAAAAPFGDGRASVRIADILAKIML